MLILYLTLDSEFSCDGERSLQHGYTGRLHGISIMHGSDSEEQRPRLIIAGCNRGFETRSQKLSIERVEASRISQCDSFVLAHDQH